MNSFHLEATTAVNFLSCSELSEVNILSSVFRPGAQAQLRLLASARYSFNLSDILDEQHFVAPFVVDQFVDDLLGYQHPEPTGPQT